MPIKFLANSSILKWLEVTLCGTIWAQSCRSRSVGKSGGPRSQGPGARVLCTGWSRVELSGATCPVLAPGCARAPLPLPLQFSTVLWHTSDQLFSWRHSSAWQDIFHFDNKCPASQSPKNKVWVEYVIVQRPLSQCWIEMVKECCVLVLAGPNVKSALLLASGDRAHWAVVGWAGTWHETRGPAPTITRATATQTFFRLNICWCSCNTCNSHKSCTLCQSLPTTLDVPVCSLKPTPQCHNIINKLLDPHR